MSGKKGSNFSSDETLKKNNQDEEINEVVIMNISPTFKLVEFTPDGESEYVKDLLYCEDGKPCEEKVAPKIIHVQRRQIKRI